MKKTKILTLVTLILIISGCANTNTLKVNEANEPKKSDAQKACEAKGGHYNTFPGAALYGNPCYIKYPDAEKKCTSSDQCQGNCITNIISQMGKSGVCEKDTQTTGCWNKIENKSFTCREGDMAFSCGKNTTDPYTISTCKDLKEDGAFLE